MAMRNKLVVLSCELTISHSSPKGGSLPVIYDSDSGEPLSVDFGRVLLPVINRRADQLDRRVADLGKQLQIAIQLVQYQTLVNEQLLKKIESLEEQVSASKKTKLKKVA